MPSISSFSLAALTSPKPPFPSTRNSSSTCLTLAASRRLSTAETCLKGLARNSRKGWSCRKAMTRPWPAPPGMLARPRWWPLPWVTRAGLKKGWTPGTGRRRKWSPAPAARAALGGPSASSQRSAPPPERPWPPGTRQPGGPGSPGRGGGR